ncbi:YdhK family protein [Alkalicoccobacillus porphyridii]|uniref:DUF1541 domain-containing protein n=1 Tax=Alkalicoccobacillus porphyridii TaxID=2597270 RepID=A0A554A0M3_9BACI|nr:YdhK family protein [Alkalicoccobacillus porphyridii]TSB47242.1 DUF1541 domain-containing protein [Alkalicoccobacillus porphyridii]
MKKWLFLWTATVLILSGCNADGTIKDQQPSVKNETADPSNQTDQSATPQLPEGLTEEPDPTYAIGSNATILTDQSRDMHRAEAVIVGAYNTTAYAVSYKPTNATDDVWNHKWVIKEELTPSDSTNLEPGHQVTLHTDRIQGMEGAKATIESSQQTTVYMVNFVPTNGEDEVINYQWVTEQELSTTE